MTAPTKRGKDAHSFRFLPERCLNTTFAGLCRLNWVFSNAGNNLYGGAG